MLPRSQPFGRTPDGDVVERYTLETPDGFSVCVLTYGGRLCSIRTPDRHGQPGDVLLGFDNLHQYVKDDSYFGAIIGRYANRLPGGRFTLDGTEYQLSMNNPHWTLHGGKRGFDKALWSPVPGTGPEELRLTHESPHLSQGFPGTLRLTVTFRVERPATLRIDYEAQTDRPTVINMTQHPYLNLAGPGKGTIRDHLLTLFTDRYLALDGLLPTGQIASAAGTALDFRTAKPLGQDLGKGLATVQGGYDYTYVLAPPGEANTPRIRLAAHVHEPSTGRSLEVSTNQPGLQVYTGNELDGTTHGRGGAYPKYASLSLEPEHFPDSVHHPEFPSTRLDPGQLYHTTSIFRFFTQ